MNQPKHHNAPSLKRIWYLATHLLTTWESKDLATLRKDGHAWHTVMHDGTLDECDAEMCIQLRRLELKAKEYYL